MIWVWFFWFVGLTISTVVGSWLVRRFRDTLGYPALLTFYISYIIASNILASRISEFNILTPLLLSGGTITFPFVAQLIDMINEIYGRRATYNAILLAFIANVMVSMFIFMLSTVPPAPWLVSVDDVWKYFMLQTPRVVIASYTAFIVAEFLDATVFAEIKKRVYRYEVSTKNMLKGVLLRSVGSDVINMIVDSLVFFPLAFAYTVPWDVVWGMIWYGTYAKVLLSVLDTPWFVVFRLWTKGVRREL
ncbi:MAG: queuosine precursor transporter [Desulfurococcaceae archaeon]|nr:queuosine precursor transporter [Desulfurococcaceae archaeon]